jgi:hypothetical protein
MLTILITLVWFVVCKYWLFPEATDMELTFLVFFGFCMVVQTEILMHINEIKEKEEK